MGRWIGRWVDRWVGVNGRGECRWSAYAIHYIA